MAYPSVISTISNPQASDRLNNPSHSSIHQAENTAITEIETFVGTLSSTVGTLVYDIRAAASNGGGHVQTANKGGTGQTTFTKGDVLVASSSSVLTKLAIGGDTLVLTADASQATGVKWASPAAVVVTSLISNGSWSRPGGISPTSRTFVELWGGGGSGGAGSVQGFGAGGGGGGYISGWYYTSVLSSVVQVDIGAGGTAVVANSPGNAGGSTVFNPASSMLTAYGGGGGDGGGGNGNHAGGGGGGVFQTGQTAIRGEASVYGGKAAQDAAQATPGFYIGGAGGGGGGGGSYSPSIFSTGATALFGGSGGGSASSSVQGLGGASVAGGAGGNGSVVGAGVGQSGFIPGGGGGGAFGTGATSGAGGNGRAVMTTFL